MAIYDARGQRLNGPQGLQTRIQYFNLTSPTEEQAVLRRARTKPCCRQAQNVAYYRSTGASRPWAPHPAATRLEPHGSGKTHQTGSSFLGTIVQIGAATNPLVRLNAPGIACTVLYERSPVHCKIDQPWSGCGTRRTSRPICSYLALGLLTAD